MTTRLLVLLTAMSAAAAGELTAQLPAPVGGPSPSSMDDFVLEAGVVLRVRVWPDSALGGDFPIEDSGVVHLPILGGIEAAGRTVKALRTEIRAGYARDLQAPVVIVTPRFRVSVLGAVRSPGTLWIDPSYGLFELIGASGGFTDRANPDGVVVWRHGESMAHGSGPVPVAGPAAGFRLASGDRVTVPTAGRGMNWLATLQVLTLLVSVAGLALR